MSWSAYDAGTEGAGRLRTIYRFDRFTLSTGEPELNEDGVPVPIEPRVLQVLGHLVAHADRVVAKQELLDTVWAGLAVGDAVVHRCISRARRALGDDGRTRRFIVTLGQGGYRFVGRVSVARVFDDSEVDANAAERAALAPAVMRPTLPATVPTKPMVGRAAELRALDARLADLVEKRRGGVITITGEPGIGKSRLLEELARRAGSLGVRVLEGRCPEVAGAPPFWAWVEIVRMLAAEEDGASLLESLGPAATDIAAVVPEVSAAAAATATEASKLAPEHRRFRFFDSTARLLTAAARRRPTLVVVDDLHCADDASLRLLQRSTVEAGREPLLIACAYRSYEARRRPVVNEVLAEIVRDVEPTTLELEGLTSYDVALLVEQLVPGLATRELAVAIHARSEGNPLFVRELARAARARGASWPRGDGRHDDVPFDVPTDLRRAIGVGLDALDAACRRVVEHAAVIGRRFGLTLLQAVCDDAPDVTTHALDEAAARDLLAEVPGAVGHYAFRHVLIRDVLYASLPAGRRIEIHRRVAECIERLYGSQAEDWYEALAYHHLASVSAASAERAMTYALRAAEHASRKLAYEEAAELYEQALAALEASDSGARRRRCELLLEVADARAYAGDAVAARASYEHAAESARAIGASDLLVHAALGTSFRFGQPVDFGGTYDARAAELLEDALASMSEPVSVDRALVLAGLSFSLYLSPDRAKSVASGREAEKVARATGDPYPLAVALLARHVALLGPENAAEATVVVDELIDVAAAADRADVNLLGQTYRVFRCFDAASDAASLDAAIAEHGRLAERSRQPQALWWADVFGAARALMIGDCERGDRLSRRAREHAQRSGITNQDLVYCTQHGQVLLHKGNLPALCTLSADVARRYPRIQASQAVYATLRAMLGDTQAAHAFAEQWRGRELAGALQAEDWLFEAACLAELSATLGDRELAEQVHDFLADYRDRHVMVGHGIAYHGPVSRYLAMVATTLGRRRAADEAFEDAIERALDLDALPCAARTQLAYARHLLGDASNGSRELACTLVVAAVETNRRVRSALLDLEVGVMRGALGC